MARLIAWLAAMALMAASTAWAEQTQVIRDEQGRRKGTVETGSDGRRIIRDEHGRRMGSIEPGAGGRQVIRDEQGRRIGTVETR